MRTNRLSFARAVLLSSSLLASVSGCDKPAAAKPGPAQSAAAQGAAPAPAPGAVEALPPSAGSGKFELTRSYLFLGIGRAEGVPSVLQQNLADSFTPGVAACARQHGVRGGFGIMLLTKPDRGELEVNGVKGPTQVERPFVDCTREVYRRAQMPEGERFDGMLMLDYVAN